MILVKRRERNVLDLQNNTQGEKLSSLHSPLSTLHPKKLSLLLSFIILLPSCSVDLPSYVISEGKMEYILYDYHIAQGMAEAQNGDIEANRYIYVQKVFEKHGITEAEFDSSMVWYSGHASHLNNMYKHIEARLERESREAGLNIPEEDKFARFTAEGDTANIWQGNEMLFLKGNREENLYTLVIPADTSFHKGDHFMLRFGNRFITQDNQRETFALLQVHYDNDSVAAATVMINGDYDITLNLTEDKIKSDYTIKSLTCTFYYHFDETRDDAFRLWVVTKPVLLRYHAMGNKPEASDSLTTDTLTVDTLDADTATKPKRQTRVLRISPEEFRENQQVDRKINIVKQRSVVLPKKNTQRKRVR